MKDATRYTLVTHGTGFGAALLGGSRQPDGGGRPAPLAVTDLRELAALLTAVADLREHIGSGNPIALPAAAAERPSRPSGRQKP